MQVRITALKPAAGSVSARDAPDNGGLELHRAHGLSTPLRFELSFAGGDVTKKAEGT